MNTDKKKAKVKKAPDGVYEVIFPDGTSKWCYTKDDADFLKDNFNSKIK